MGAEEDPDLSPRIGWSNLHLCKYFKRSFAINEAGFSTVLSMDAAVGKIPPCVPVMTTFLGVKGLPHQEPRNGT